MDNHVPSTPSVSTVVSVSGESNKIGLRQDDVKPITPFAPTGDGDNLNLIVGDKSLEIPLAKSSLNGSSVKAEDELIELDEDSPADDVSPAREWLFVLDLDLAIPPIHICDSLKTFVASGDLSAGECFSTFEWPTTQRHLLWSINFWLRGSCESIYKEIASFTFMKDDRNLETINRISKTYLFKFLKNVDEFDRMVVPDDLNNGITGGDLFEREWIEYKRERVNGIVEELQIVEIDKNSFVVLPNKNILSLTQTIDWCNQKNSVEVYLSDEKHLEFVDFDVPILILNKEQKGVMKPVPETKRLVLRFYRWIVTYIERLINDVKRIKGDPVLNLTREKLWELITDRDHNSPFIKKHLWAKSDLYVVINSLWSLEPNTEGDTEYKISSSNKILTDAVKYEENVGTSDELTGYDKAIGRAFYLYVVEMVVGGGQNPSTTSEVPKDYFKSSLTKGQFIGILKKFKHVILDTALTMNNKLGQTESMKPVDKYVPGWYRMTNVGERISGFLATTDE